MLLNPQGDALLPFYEQIELTGPSLHQQRLAFQTGAVRRSGSGKHAPGGGEPDAVRDAADPSEIDDE